VRDGNITKIWYVSGTLTSTTRPHVAAIGCQVLALASLWLGGCAAGTNQPAVVDPGRQALVAGPAPEVAKTTTLPFAGARCHDGTCACRDPLAAAAAVETAPPADGMKRLELRISAAGGQAALDLGGLGNLAVEGDGETCAYVDVPGGSKYDVVFSAIETGAVRGGGVAPRMRIAEYGPKGPYWYDLVAVTCDGPGGRCDRNAADAWSVAAKQRKRGRLDPCGSGVVTRLQWESSGGQGERDGALFRDFTVKFTLEMKKFATQFAPGSTECVPK